MNLHEYPNDFRDLITETASYIGIPEEAVRRDYFIVMLLQQLEVSAYADQCVFKGGTSLSKCYPETIKRFSEDIDITFLMDECATDKKYDKMLKLVEKAIAGKFRIEKIAPERNKRNKSSYVYFGEGNAEYDRIKLEIGSNVRPDPYDKRSLQTYIQEYLANRGQGGFIQEFDLKTVSINTLKIERTFLDKVMAVKRHAMSGNLVQKMRHVYDVAMLFPREEIQAFLSDQGELKRLLQLTKKSDSFYLQKRSISGNYNPCAVYDFPSWRAYFDKNARDVYESLHKTLLYTNEPQDFRQAIDIFDQISRVFADLGE